MPKDTHRFFMNFPRIFISQFVQDPRFNDVFPECPTFGGRDTQFKQVLIAASLEEPVAIKGDDFVKRIIEDKAVVDMQKERSAEISTRFCSRSRSGGGSRFAVK